jgi:hypothetical protein
MHQVCGGSGELSARTRSAGHGDGDDGDDGGGGSGGATVVTAAMARSAGSVVESDSGEGLLTIQMILHRHMRKSAAAQDRLQ